MKISYKQYCEIANIKNTYFIQSLLKYSLNFQGSSCRVRVEVPVWLYLILFLPIHIAEFFLCLWDGGLKEFEIHPRQLYSWTYYAEDQAYKIARKIYWEKA